MVLPWLQCVKGESHGWRRLCCSIPRSSVFPQLRELGAQVKAGKIAPAAAQAALQEMARDLNLPRPRCDNQLEAEFKRGQGLNPCGGWLP